MVNRRQKLEVREREFAVVRKPEPATTTNAKKRELVGLARRAGFRGKSFKAAKQFIRALERRPT
jgi:hypothetical protein